MITKFDATNRQGSLLTFQMEDISNGYSVQEIQGLGPVKATLVSTSFAGMDGEQPQSSRREIRNIVLKIGIETDFLTNSVDELRQALYGYFMPTSEVNLKFYKPNGLIVSIDGVVETCEPDIFTQDPTVDVSIICYSPDFVVPTVTHRTGNTVSTTADTTIKYNGSVKTGYVLTLNVDRTLSDFSIYHTPPDGEIRTMDFSGSLVSGDVVTISTVFGDKGATLVHLGTTTSVLYAVSPQSVWSEFQPGDNYFRVYAAGAGVPYTIDYYERYGAL